MKKNDDFSVSLPLFQAPPQELTNNEQSRDQKEKVTKKTAKSDQKTDVKSVRRRKRLDNTDQDKMSENKSNESIDSSKKDGENDIKQKSSRVRKRTRSKSDSNASEQNKDINANNSSKSSKNKMPITESTKKSTSQQSTRLDSKKIRRKDNRDLNKRRTIIQEADFLASRDNVDRKMVIRDHNNSQQIAVLEDGILVEHYVSEQSNSSVVGNIYLGKVQNVLPGMEAAFVDIGEGRNAVLYAGELNWDATKIDKPESRRIEMALNKGDSVLVQVTKDPINLKGARLTAQITLTGRYLVLVPSEGINGISRKLSDRERGRIRKILDEYKKEDFSIIVRTLADGVPEEELKNDIERLKAKWDEILKASKKAKAPATLHTESDLIKRVIRDKFDESFSELIVSGKDVADQINEYFEEISPTSNDKITNYIEKKDVFDTYKISEQLAKGLDRKVWLPSGGTLIIDRTEAMTVIDINTGKFIGNNEETSLEETVTKNNLEAAEEIVRQLRLRDIGGIVVIDFIDMILQENREKVLNRLLECLSRDRTKHQVAEVTSLGLVQLTRKRVGQGLIEAFSTTCAHCGGSGYLVHNEPVEKDINSIIFSDQPDGYHEHFVGASHELEDGSQVVNIDDVSDEQKEENRRRLASIASTISEK